MLVCVLLLLAAIPSMPDPAPGSIREAARLTAAADAAFRAGRTADAVAGFHKALARVDKYPDAELGLGHVALKERRFADALAHYEAARDAYAPLGKAIFAERQRRWAEVQAEIRTIELQLSSFKHEIELEGTYQRGPEYNYAALTNRLGELHRYEEPRADAVTEPPGEIHFHVGNALYRLGRADEAIAAWERCTARTPLFGPAFANLAAAYAARADGARARAALARAEELKVVIAPELRAAVESAAAKR